MPLAVLLLSAALAFQPPPVSCADVTSCRADAEAAAARGDYETFHDLAWRAIQKGKPNDPTLMFLLARAQSLSGRPDDAIVMLGRLADLHVPIDLSRPEFARARTRPGWATLEQKVAGTPAPKRAGPPSDAAAAPATAARTAAPAPPSLAVPEAAVPRAAAPAAPKAAAAPAPAPEPGEVTTFEAPAALAAFAIAHDTVSRRFVIGDAASRRLLVVDEVSKHVVPYVSAASAGFYDQLTSLALDAKRGDLWVASVKGRGDEATSVVHKLQLVSGRGLMEVRPDEALHAVRIVDLTVAPDGTVYALDAAGGRILRVRAGTRAFEIVLGVDAPDLAAVVAIDDRALLVASGRGLLHVDLTAHAVQAVKSLEDLGGFTSLSWRGGALYAVQHVAGASLAVRVAIDGATRARPRAILASAQAPIVATVSDGAFYYLVLDAIHRLPTR
jgi:hypothetical protein